jgi:ubiquinone/menaquinone biosynthesis C-methylase UbiE
MSQPPERPSPAALFDALAPAYDQSGVAFFQPVGARLVELLGPRAGERALDIGCGRGAVTMPLAERVGAGGEVVAVDVAPAMVEATRRLAEERGLSQVRTSVADASDLAGSDLAGSDLAGSDLVGAGFDLVASSLVLFFLPEPQAALTGWLGLARPGGRVGISTFGPLDDTSRALDSLFDPWLPQGLLDARTSGASGPFATDDGVVGLMEAAGASQVDNRLEPVAVRFDDVDAWRRFSMSTGQRAMWAQVPPAEVEGVLERARQLLAATGPGAGATLTWHLRYTLGRR